MKIKWHSNNSLVGSEREEVFIIDDNEIEELRKVGYTEEYIQHWIQNEVKQEVMNYFEWSYEII
jgi:hypothetical protein